MDRHTIRRVQLGWKFIEANSMRVSSLFYSNLFESAPSLRPLFKGNIAAQGMKLMQMIGVAVTKLDTPETLFPILKALAIRHVEYGVQKEHYDMVGAALLAALEQAQASSFSSEDKEAWRQVYEKVAGIMIDAAYSGR